MKGLEDDSLNLPEKCHPAVQLKIFKARSGMRIKYCDEMGYRVDPCEGVRIEMYDGDGLLKVYFTPEV